MSSSSASGCALVDLQQQQLADRELADRACWTYEDADTIVDEAFEEVLRDHPDLRNAVKVQVSVLCQSFK